MRLVVHSGMPTSPRSFFVTHAKAARGTLKNQKPCVLWFTGLSGAGKSTIANMVEKKLHAMGRHTYLLDGDNVRHGLNKDLGTTVLMTEATRGILGDRVEAKDCGTLWVKGRTQPLRVYELLALRPESEGGSPCAGRSS